MGEKQREETKENVCDVMLKMERIYARGVYYTI